MNIVPCAAKVTWEASVAEEIQCTDRTLAPLMVALVGIPGSGKTTSAQLLAGMIPDCLVLPMDGYHYSIAELKAMENPKDLIYRRGAPDTFNAAAFKADLREIREGSCAQLSLPGFEHSVGDPSPDAHKFVRALHKTVIVEGLYLLHEQGEWRGTASLFDLTVFLESDVDECVRRLKVRNRCIPGYSPEQIDARCEAVDRVNAELVAQDSLRADKRVPGHKG